MLHNSGEQHDAFYVEVYTANVDSEITISISYNKSVAR
jgi:hypothetical protein